MNEETPLKARKRGGRPRKSEDELRTVYIGFWATPEEATAIHARASAAGFFAVGAFARAAAAGAPLRTTRTPGHSPEVVAQLRYAGNNVNQCLVEARRGNFPPDVAAAAEEALRDISVVLRGLLHAPEH